MAEGGLCYIRGVELKQLRKVQAYSFCIEKHIYRESKRG